MEQNVFVTILVAEGFVPTKLALVQDILRIASRLNQSMRFVSQICSMGEEGVLEGLGSASCFSKIFAREFGISPARRRAQLSAAATQHQPNSQP